MPLQRRNPNEYRDDPQNTYRAYNGPPSSAHEVSPIDEESPYSFHPNTDRIHPAAHPQSSYNAMRQDRISGVDYYSTSSASPPPPPVHSRDNYPHVPATESAVTAGVDNLGATAVGGGIAGVARGVAHGNESYGGHNIPRGYRDDSESISYRGAPDYANNGAAYGNPYQNPPNDQFAGQHVYTSEPTPAMGPGYHNSDYASSSSHFAPSDRGIPASQGQPPNQHGPGYYDGPYQRNSAAMGGLGPETINPNDIVDDGDDGFLAPKRRSVLSLGRNSSHNSLGAGAGAGAAAGAGVLGGVAGRAGGQTHSGSDDGPEYTAVPTEKAELANYENGRKKRAKWILIIVGALLLAGAIAGGVAGGVLSTRGKSDKTSGSSGQGSADDDTAENGDLNKDSEEIKALMGNSNLHKVFPGIDYTPWGTQYPLCMKWPPSQNNVTRDMAVLSQLTNVVRLYGTDCNQTEMVLHAIDKLELKDMKLWMGVWIDTNTTTNNRQLKLMEKILSDAPDTSIFKGVIVGNEYLFRGHQTQEALDTLGKYITGVKKTLKELKIDLPVATSDLGDAWTDGLAKISDAVMSNVHPFFGGVPVDEAAGWTWSFWNNHNVPLTKGTNKDNLISEVGWPTGGGNSCGENQCTSSSSGSVAGVKQLNQFMEDWVCQSLENGTDYFWFEAFDEPWKVAYNEKGKEWEDKWGLMDPGRNLKPGLKIPDCGGKTAK